MIFTQASLALLGVTAGFVAAAPVVEKRAGPTDADILNYALTLEHLEDKFYRQGLATFKEIDFLAAGFDSSFYANLQKISSDESTHVSFLTSALTAAGAPAVAECTYNFGYHDPRSFVATASILEGVGVSAYLGAAASIANKGYLTAAGSILTVESRHSSIIRASLSEVPFAQPFDTPLDLDQVYSLASGFITGCPSSNPALPVKAFPKLTLAPTNTAVTSGCTITLQTSGSAPSGTVYAAFFAVTGPTFAAAHPVNGGFSVTVPSGFAGQTYVVLTTSNQSVTDENTVAGPAIVEIGDEAESSTGTGIIISID